ncbi:MAG: ABC transporter substrate-binding protein [Candidatus Elarobacter sp.]
MSTAKRWAWLAAASFVVATLGADTRDAGAQAKTFKIGFLYPVTGVFAAPGKYMQEGLELYLKEHNGMLGGLKADVDIADDQGNPSVGLTQIRKLVEQDHVDVVFGPLSAAVGSAIVPYIEQHKVAAVYPIVSSDDLTQRTPSEYILRTEWSSSQPTHVLGDYAYKTLKYRKVATIAYDFSFGWESLGGFVDTFQRDGGKITKQVWTPLVTSDYSPYLSALPRDVDAVMCSYSGSAAVNFIKQYKAFGLKMPLLCQGNTTDESTLPESPDAAGMVTALQYSAALKSPANGKFVAAYTKAYGHEPSYYAEGTYVGAQYLDRGLAAVKGNTGDPLAFIKAMRGVRITDAPRGPVHFDDRGNPVQNIYIRRVEQVNGKLENVVLQTYPNVSQFWTYNPAEYLKQPVYDRTHPACNGCG